ncbi:MAG: hypothetical protein IJQ73_07920, partial [Kiritimatiellae bacterium]|nr:hypothetical protein [Kiritimatiellia bacterium]
FPLYDNNGNVTDYVSETGEVVASYAYDAFGRTIAQSGAMADVFPFRFSTKYYDAETGLYYYGYRYYSPELGRWLTRDPIEEDGGDNLYAFCGNNGVNRIDGRGLFCPFVNQWAQQVRNHLGMKDEKGAAFWAHEIYTLLAQGGVYYEPLAASLMSYWLNGETKTYTIPSRHVYRAITGTWIEDDWAILMIKYYGASKEFDEEGSWRGSLTFSCGCGK